MTDVRPGLVALGRPVDNWVGADEPFQSDRCGYRDGLIDGGLDHRPPCRGGRPDTLIGVTIVPDAKDWTWVLHRTCPECGFDTQSFPRAAVPPMLRENAAAWSAVLARSGDLRSRPRPDVWSPLEYACHVRDVFRIYAYRLDLMLIEDDPAFPNWDQDATAVADRYAEQDPATVREELTVAAEKLAAGFAAVADGAWDRTGTRSDGARFTVESFARYLLHDPVHHLYDVTGEPAAIGRPET